jgi:plastocyanin
MMRMRLAALALAAACASASAATHVVAIDGVAYVPPTITVKRGDTIVWRNDDPFPHTVTAKGRFDSGEIAAGAQWKFVARSAGTFPYICTLHPNLQGTVIVEN